MLGYFWYLQVGPNHRRLEEHDLAERVLRPVPNRMKVAAADVLERKLPP